MGHGFGELYKLRGIITYKISPFEIRAFAGAISHGVPNLLRRVAGEFFYVVPRMYLCTQWIFLNNKMCFIVALALGYLVYDQVEKRHEQLMRKNPADYENDQ